MLTSLPASFAPSHGICPKCNGMAWFFGPMNATGRNTDRDPCPACSASGRSHPSLRDTKILVDGVLQGMPGSKDRAVAILERLKHRVAMIGGASLQHVSLLSFMLTMTRVDLALLEKAGYAAEVITACRMLQDAIIAEKDMLRRAAKLAACGNDIAIAAASLLNEVKPPPGVEAAVVRRALRPEWLILNAADFGVTIQPGKTGGWAVASLKAKKQSSTVMLTEEDGGWTMAIVEPRSSERSADATICPSEEDTGGAEEKCPAREDVMPFVDALDRAIALVRPAAMAA